MKKMIVTGAALVLLGCMRTNAMLVKTKTLTKPAKVNIILKTTKDFAGDLAKLFTPNLNPKIKVEYSRLDTGKKTAKKRKLEGPGTSYNVEHTLPNPNKPNEKIKKKIKENPKLFSLRKWKILTGERKFSHTASCDNTYLKALINFTSYEPSNKQIEELNKDLEEVKLRLAQVQQFPHTKEKMTKDTKNQVKQHNKLVKKLLNLKLK